MTKVAVLDLDLNENIGRKEFDAISNSELIEMCEGDDLIFSLEGFQVCINNDYLCLDNCFIRFIEINE